MATAFTHGFVASAMGKIFTNRKMPVRFWVLTVFCSILPDADVIGLRFGIRYGDMLGHRGISHSLLFALGLGLLIVFLAFRDVPKFSRKWLSLGAYFFAVTASHGVLDAMTTGGLGIGFFIPFDNTRYFLPWRPIQVSPIRLTCFFSLSTVSVLKSEFFWACIPAALAAVAATVWRKLRNSRSYISGR